MGGTSAPRRRKKQLRRGPVPEAEAIAGSNQVVQTTTGTRAREWVFMDPTVPGHKHTSTRPNVYYVSVPHAELLYPMRERMQRASKKRQMRGLGRDFSDAIEYFYAEYYRWDLDRVAVEMDWAMLFHTLAHRKGGLPAASTENCDRCMVGLTRPGQDNIRANRDAFRPRAKRTSARITAETRAGAASSTVSPAPSLTAKRCRR